MSVASENKMTFLLFFYFGREYGAQVKTVPRIGTEISGYWKGTLEEGSAHAFATSGFGEENNE